MSIENVLQKADLLECCRAFKEYKEHGVDYLKKKYPHLAELIIQHQEKSIEEAIDFFQKEIDRLNGQE